MHNWRYRISPDKEVVDMPAQHKRPGRKAKEERIRRAREREAAKKIKVLVRRPRYEERYDGISPGRLVIYAEVKHGA